MTKYKLGNLTKIYTGKLNANAAVPDGKYPFFTCSKEISRIDHFSYDCECVLVAGNGDLNVKYYNGKFDAYQRTYIIESNGNNILYMPYLYYFMSLYIEKLRAQTIGGVIKYIKLNNLTDAPIDLPTFSEQKKIVAILNKAKSVNAKKSNELKNLDTLIKARFVEMFGDPIINKKEWDTEIIKDVCSNIFGGGTPSKKHPEYYIGDIPWISPKDMKTETIENSKDHITEDAISHSTTKLIPVNSVLMVIRSGILKHDLPVAINKVAVTMNQDMKAFVPGPHINEIFLLNYFKSIESDVLSRVRGVTADNIDFKDFQKRKIIVPPIELQNEFASFVQQVDKSKVAIQNSLDETQTLFDSLMQKYFS